MKFKFLLITIIFLALILSACDTSTSNEFDSAVSVSLTQTAVALSQEQSFEENPTDVMDQNEPAILKGTIDPVSFSSPSIIIYALDPDSGQWATTQITKSDQAVVFELFVPAGNYIVYAFSEDGSTYFGYPNTDDSDLALLDVDFGETIENLYVRQPIPWNCGVMWGVPDAPDGRFAGYMASEACINSNWVEGNYMVPSSDLCQMLEGIAQETLGIPFVMNMNDSFMDIVTGESGGSCTIFAQTTQDQLSIQNSVIQDLQNAFIGWEEDPLYMADGPTGSATALRRDMALMLLSATWEPVAGIDCPDDQPINACNLTPAEKLYTIQIQIGMK